MPSIFKQLSEMFEQKQSATGKLIAMQSGGAAGLDAS